MQKNKRVFVLLIVCLFISELLIMLFFELIPKLPSWLEAILDASLLAMLIFPIIYDQLFKPLKKSIAHNIEKETKYQELIENMGDAVVIVDVHEACIFVNTAAEQLFGEPKNKLIGQKIDQYFNKENPNVKHIQKIKGSSSNFETEILTKQGTAIPVYVNETPQYSGGSYYGRLSIIRNISDLKRAEARIKYERNLFKALFDNLPDAVYVKDINYKKILANPIDLKYMGELNEEDVIGKTDFEIYKKDVADSSFTDDKQVFTTGEAIINKEDFFIDNKNEQHWMLNSKVPFRNNKNEVIGLVGISREITEKKILEQNYIKAKENAESANKAKSEFLANMSHEIRTPLNSVIGFSDLLKKTKLDETQKLYNNAVFQSANSLLDIITEILDFSKIEAGKLEIDISKTDINELALGITSMVSFQAHEKNLEVLMNIGSDIPRFIWVDSLRLRQILINLMSNAVKFTKEGEIELKIETINKISGENSLIRFSVRDTGIGILPENQKKIFEAFTQEDASTTRKYGGTGLGLAISKKLLHLMGSELQLISEPQVGSMFYFDIMLKTLQGIPEESADISKIKNVLIVDDNANNRVLVKEMLMLKNVKTEAVESGKQALQALQQANVFDLVLMDFNMADMDGIETIRHIRNDLKLSPKELPIILLHSSADDEHIIDASKELGVAGRLVKPIHIQSLYDCISKSGIQSKVENTIAETTSYVNAKEVKVLLADDNDFNILLIKQMIANLLPNAIVHEAVNGMQAVALFEKERPDIVFMDVQMPEMNGHEATRKIRALAGEKHIPIIALTAGTHEDEREKCINAGMDDFVTKPFVIELLEQVIAKWLPG